MRGERISQQKIKKLYLLIEESQNKDAKNRRFQLLFKNFKARHPEDEIPERSFKRYKTDIMKFLEDHPEAIFDDFFSQLTNNNNSNKKQLISDKKAEEIKNYLRKHQQQNLKKNDVWKILKEEFQIYISPTSKIIKKKFGDLYQCKMKNQKNSISSESLHSSLDTPNNPGLEEQKFNIINNIQYDNNNHDFQDNSYIDYSNENSIQNQNNENKYFSVQNNNNIVFQNQENPSHFVQQLLQQQQSQDDSFENQEQNQQQTSELQQQSPQSENTPYNDEQQQTNHSLKNNSVFSSDDCAYSFIQ